MCFALPQIEGRHSSDVQGQMLVDLQAQLNARYANASIRRIVSNPSVESIHDIIKLLPGFPTNGDYSSGPDHQGQSVEGAT